MQSASALQVVLHAVAPQTYWSQAVTTAAGQAPAPVQLAAAVASPAAQVAPRHCAVGYAQAAALLPSPDPPHDEPSLTQAVRAPCGAPATAVHWPTLPGTSHAWHWPLQAWLQQTPSAHEPFAH